MAGRHAREHGCGFDVLADHRLVAADDGERARGGDAQGVHGLGGEVFADRGAQHGAAVAHARVGRLARALELQVPAALRAGGFAQQDGAAVAQLGHEHAELVARIHGGERIEARQQAVAAENLGELRALRLLAIEADQIGRGRVEGDQIGVGQRRRRKPGVEGRRQPAVAVVEAQLLQLDRAEFSPCDIHVCVPSTLVRLRSVPDRTGPRPGNQPQGLTRPQGGPPCAVREPSGACSIPGKGPGGQSSPGADPGVSTPPPGRHRVGRAGRRGESLFFPPAPGGLFGSFCFLAPMGLIWHSAL